MLANRINQVSERRRYRRVRVHLVGRYMLADGTEYDCRVRDMSPGGLALMASASGQVGERVIAYIDDIGRVEGKIARVFTSGFAMVIAATEHGRDRIARRLTRAANQQVLPEVIT
jgi:PilZ domain-containing protein